MNAQIWVLADSRLGNTKQAIALAEELAKDKGLIYEVKQVGYTPLAALPNYLLHFYPIHIKSKSLQSLLQSDAPRLIISSGRRTATLATYLKKKFNSRQGKDKVHIIQIMKPDLSFAEFDLIVLPQHDEIGEPSSNVARIIGALSSTKNSSDSKKSEAASMRQYYPELRNFIAVIIGGNSKKSRFNTTATKEFVDILIKLSKHHAIPFVISFSRRTPEKLKELINKNFLWPNIIYDPASNKPNPYQAMITEAEYIISTADSISMCSEAASIGKPLYIFWDKDFKLKKHRFFVQQLIDLGIAKKLDNSVDVLKTYYYEPLHEVRKIADIIRTEIL